jgi:cytochrome c oxidase subunit 2
MGENFPLWPTGASAVSGQTDALMLFLIAVTGFFTVVIFITIFVFALRYRKEHNPVATDIHGSNLLEITWSIIPLGIFLIMFVWGAYIYMGEYRPPKDAMEIFVVGKQWMWKFEHPEGQREIDELHVPLGRDVMLTMISQDVIHDLFIPAFRVKQDVLPGRYTTLWFRAIKPGRYHLFCSQYCGTMHSGMVGEVVVMDPATYQAWLSGGNAEGSLASTGQKLFQQLGCSSCHRFDTQGRGPNLVGVYGKPVLLDDGQTVVADDNYVRESILSPGAKVVAGFRPIMPSFNGIVSEEQLLSLVAYIKSISQPEQREPVSNRPAVPPHVPATTPKGR